MFEIKVSYDEEAFCEKPTENKIVLISNRIAGNVKKITVDNIREFVASIGLAGHTFCPATFKGSKRKTECFEQQQLFALDFDNKNCDRKISFEEVRRRSEKYDLPILFAYDTFSSINHNKFRVVYLNDISISDRRVAKAMQLVLGTIFPESDSSCYKDVSKMYFGGSKEILYYDKTHKMIDIELLFRSHYTYLKDTSNSGHHKDKLRKFSRDTGIRILQNGLLDVTTDLNTTERSGATQLHQNGEISPSPIIYRIANGEKSPKKYYRINFSNDIGSTKDASVGRTAPSRTTDNTKKRNTNHNLYRSDTLHNLSQGCRLYREFERGIRDMTHDELFGISCNLIQVEGGAKKLKDIQANTPEYYDAERISKWETILSYIKLQEYKPQDCDGYCKYRNECEHGKNILSTVAPRRNSTEKVLGYNENFDSIKEVELDVYNAIRDAFYSSDTNFHIIKAMTSIGKTSSYLRLMQENSTARFIIAAPTNLLKDEIEEKAKKMGLPVKETPSLEAIKDEIPDDVQNHIQRLYSKGQHYRVHSYIADVIKKEKIPCLEEYMKERESLKTFKGSVITTHRYLTAMDEKRLNEFDAVIIDEDIIFKSALTGQCEIPLSKSKKLESKTTNSFLKKKVRKLLSHAKDESCIELISFDWDEEDDKKYIEGKHPLIDIAAFCSAEKFYIRKKENGENVEKDTVVFLKPILFHSIKYIMVSATADERICREFFYDRKIEFYKCKKARYEGVLKQYPGRSMSRSSIASDPDVVSKLMEKFDLDESRVITFKNQDIGQLHFGNTEGSNTLEGEDILVVGTPYHADFIYKLAAFTMDMDFDEDEKMVPQTVTYNGYRFRFTTYKNENLKAIHFWMIESELEQAVGRARLLRNSCEVHLFSNFILSQAEIVEDFDYNKK